MGHAETATRAPMADASWSESDTQASIPSRFAAVVAAHSGRLAIDGAAALTYGELDALAASYEAACDTGAADRVALLLPHGESVLAAALGALRAGHAVVTLNPSDPPARLAQIRASVRPALVISDSGHAELARSAGFAEELVVLAAAGASSPASVEVDPEMLAFLICTSGSTGMPKVVMQSHSNMLHNVLRYTNGLGIRKDDRIAWLASLSGGQGLVTAWATLLNGATLCPFPIMTRGITGLADWLESQHISVLDLLPSILRSFTRALPEERRISGVRLVRLASEAAYRGDFDTYCRHFPASSRLASVLGSSETGIVAQALMSATTEVAHGRLPVGPVAEGIEVRLLDKEGAGVADGEVGEIVVYGTHLSQGYWRDEELTAQRFDRLGGERRFHTGDLGRRALDGSLTVLGRIDSQVKIRGHRLALEEVDAALAAAPDVAAAAAAVHTTPRGDARLTAYVTLRPGAQLAPGRLRRVLRTTLPPHAIPTAFVALESLPLTSTGKVDRERLAANLPVGQASPSPRTARSESERLLMSLWAEAFDDETIDPEQPFLDLGGDSLTAAVIAAGVHELFGVQLELGAFDGQLTVASMAAALEALDHGAGDGTPVETISRSRDGGPVPLSHSQLTMWRQAPGKGAGFNASAAFRILGPLDTEALRAALEEIVNRHEILRTSFVERDGEPAAVIHPLERLELPLDDLSRAPDPAARAAARLATDAERPFDLGVPPLLRLRLMRLGEHEHWLLRTIHHIVSDAASWPIFFTELATLYEAFRQRRPSPFPGELRLQFRDYVRWERARLQSESSALHSELDWWQRRLDPPVTPLRLPFERPTPIEDAGGADGVIDVLLKPQESAALDRIGNAAGATLFMSRLAVFAALAALDGDAEDLAIDTYVTLRRSAELQGMFGPMMNRSILRLRFDRDSSLREWISAVRAEVVELANHSWIPFDLMLDRLGHRGVPKPTLGTKFQVFQEVGEMRFGELELVALPRHQVAPWAFTLGVSRHRNGERWRAIFDPHRYDPEGVTQFLGRLRELAATAASDPDSVLAETYTRRLRRGHRGSAGPPTHPEVRPVLAVLSSYQTHDFESWKKGFDEDRFGRASGALAHRIYRSVEDPNVVFVSVEFDSVIEANAFLERMLTGRNPAGPEALTAPTLVEASEATYYRPPARD